MFTNKSVSYGSTIPLVISGLGGSHITSCMGPGGPHITGGPILCLHLKWQPVMESRSELTAINTQGHQEDLGSPGPVI